LKRLLVALSACLLLMGVIRTPASAESAASKVDLLCTVNADGDCLVSMTVVLRLEAAYDQLSYPLPANAKDIRMNGSGASVRQTDAATYVDISKITRGYTGTASIRFEYTIAEAVKVDPAAVEAKAAQKLRLDIPLLSGFDYPVEQMSFTITMPTSQITSQPSFTSIYQQSSIESSLKVDVRGSQIIGYSTATLNDHEGVLMSMPVPEAMFPNVSTFIREGNPEIVPMSVFAVLALVYWLLFLRTSPLLPSPATTPPAGITAGELGCHLTLAGGDLTGMVFSWAQLGYILIHVDGNGRVLLHKRMEMGNERNQFENKIFRGLFGARRVVDATGYQYATLSQRVAELVPNERSMYKGSSGNMKIFRVLACVSQIFCGICVAMNMTTLAVLQVLLGLILSAFGAVSAWLIQDIAYRTHLRGKVPVYIGGVCILIWLALGFLCGQIWIPLCCCLGQFLFGYFAAYGGRRSDLGRYDASQVLGLRRYLKHLPRTDVNRLLGNDPDFFFRLAPYALALGVIKPFSRIFGRRKLDQCPYLLTPVHGKRTAEEWARLMADAADMMDAKARRMHIEKWLAIQIRFTRKKP